VYLVRKIDNGKIYAMKQIRKKLIIEQKLQQNTILEKKILKQGKHPFIV
jgi:serum/glucocorticoid-regulated kinase 2